MSDDAESFGFGWAFPVAAGSSGQSQLCKPPSVSSASLSFLLWIWFLSIDALCHVGWKFNYLGRFRSNVD